MHKQINLLAPGRYPWCTHGGCPPVANQIDLFMHFLGDSLDGLVARPVEMDKISSSVYHLTHGVHEKQDTYKPLTS